MGEFSDKALAFLAGVGIVTITVSVAVSAAFLLGF